jgi:hypothetical protein
VKDEDWMITGRRINFFARQGDRRIKFAAQNPPALWKVSDEVLELHYYVGFRLRLAKIDGRKQITDRHKVGVSIVETGKDKSTSSIDDLSIRSNEFSDFLGAANGGDAGSSYRDRFELRIRLVHRSNTAVDDHHIRSLSTDSRYKGQERYEGEGEAA